MKKTIPHFIFTFYLTALLLFFSIPRLIAQTDEEMAQAEQFSSYGTEEGYRNAIAIYIKYDSVLNAGDTNSLGFSYWKLKEYGPALKYFEISAAKGSEAGIFNSGFNYFYGDGAEADYQKAFTYLNRISEDSRFFPEASHLKGHCLEKGAGMYGKNTKPDYWGARAYFLAAAQNGHVESMLDLAGYYNNSGKIETDYAEAKKWYEKACENENKVGCEGLASLNTKTNDSDKDQSTESSQKGDGLLQVLNAVNDGLNAYNNANANKDSQSAASGKACSGTKVGSCYKNSTNIDCHCCSPDIKNGKYICRGCGGEIILTSEQKIVKPVNTRN